MSEEGILAWMAAGSLLVLSFCILIWRQHPPGHDTRRALLPIAVVAGIVLFCVIAAGIADEAPPSAAPLPASPKQSLAFIGDRAVAEVGPMAACPDWDDYEKLISAYVAHDRIGFDQDFTSGNCTFIQKGDTGLVVDSGFTSIRVRLDKDEQAYWTSSQAGDPLKSVFSCDQEKCGP
jgi:hypothetical protein